MKQIVCALAMLLVAASASAKVEALRPDMRSMQVEEPKVASESDVPCLRSQDDERAGVITWSIRAADGTILSAGAIYVRQRC